MRSFQLFERRRRIVIDPHLSLLLGREIDDAAWLRGARLCGLEPLQEATAYRRVSCVQEGLEENVAKAQPHLS